jgi:hypothetical protein
MRESAVGSISRMKGDSLFFPNGTLFITVLIRSDKICIKNIYANMLIREGSYNGIFVPP